jgi:hypothetical protein
MIRPGHIAIKGPVNVAIEWVIFDLEMLFFLLKLRR